MVKKCIICGKEFQGNSNNSRYCSDECRNTPLYTDEINGEQYGLLTVTNAFRKNSTLYAVCKCACGNVCTVRYDSLLSGKTISCGYVNKKNLIQPLDLKGKTNKYGCTAIKQLEKHSDSYFWLCKCSCGKEFVFKGRNYYLGRYINKEDSIKARKMAEEAMFGNFLKWFQETYPDRWKKMKNTDSSENEIAISKTMGKGGGTESFDSTKR